MRLSCQVGESGSNRPLDRDPHNVMISRCSKTRHAWPHATLPSNRRPRGGRLAGLGSDRRRHRSKRPPRTLPIRPLPLRRRPSGQGSTGLMGDTGSACPTHPPNPPGHSRFTSHLPTPLRARLDDHHHRPHLRRTRRTRYRRRLVRTRTPSVWVCISVSRRAHGHARRATRNHSPPMDRRAVQLHRHPLHTSTTARLFPSRCKSRSLPSSLVDQASHARCARQCGSPTSTTSTSPSPRTAAPCETDSTRSVTCRDETQPPSASR